MRLLVINPNSSADMTEGVKQAVQSVGLPASVEIEYYTAPLASPASINNQEDINKSTQAVLADPTFNNAAPFDGVLVACYSEHTLVSRLLLLAAEGAAVTGIFEASVAATLPLLTEEGGKWGIVTTGKFWEDHLTKAVYKFLGQPTTTTTPEANTKFKGVFSTGLTAGDFHDGHVTPEVIEAKLREATRALLRTGDVQCVVMGCAGMAGLEDIIRSAVVQEYGAEKAKMVHILDGVKAGIGVLELMVRNKQMFQLH